MARGEKKSLARSLGEFFGHITKAVKSDPARERRELRRTVDETTQDDVVLRRTTIDEIEIRKKSDGAT